MRRRVFLLVTQRYSAPRDQKTGFLLSSSTSSLHILTLPLNERIVGGTSEEVGRDLVLREVAPTKK